MQRHLTTALVILGSLQAAESVAPKERFDIRGVVDVMGSPEMRRFGRSAALRLSSSTSPYAASGHSDPLTGQFRFKKVPVGLYTLDAFGRGGSARYAIRIDREAAGEQKTIRMVVRLQVRTGDLKNHLRRRYEVSYRTLSIPDKAIREFEAAEKRIQKDEYPAAIERLERAVELAPQYTTAWNRLGIIAFHQKRLPDAERYFKGAADNNPEAWDSRLRLGQVILMQGRASEAVPWVEEAVRLRPADASAHSQLALTYVELRQYDKAVPHLNETRRLDPKHYSEPQLWLARIYVAQKKYPNAVREVEEYVSIHPRSPESESLKTWLKNVRTPGSTPAPVEVP
ncbi:MAG: tetratricopeptide repeat protein [Bryobacteraceae bacterium]|nr:tetratricopeptide repeat protein [Bryobacteraceae bacterium]